MEENIIALLDEYSCRCRFLGEKVIYDNKFEFEIKDSDVILLEYLSNDSDIILPDFVTVLGKRAFYNNSVKTIKGNGVKEIKENCFANSLLVKAEMNSLNNIDICAFANCIYLEEMVCDNIGEIGYMAFANCIKLKKINLTQCKCIHDNAFFYCKSLSFVDLSSLDCFDKLSFKDCCFNTIILNDNCIKEVYYMNVDSELEIIYIGNDLDKIEEIADMYLKNFKQMSKLVIKNKDNTFQKVYINEKNKSIHKRKKHLKNVKKKSGY